MSKSVERQVKMPTKEELDMLTKMLASLDQDHLLCAVVNAVIRHDASLLTFLHRFKTIMITTAAISNDDVLKTKAVEMLRDAADLYERSILRKPMN